MPRQDPADVAAHAPRSPRIIPEPLQPAPAGPPNTIHPPPVFRQVLVGGDPSWRPPRPPMQGGSANDVFFPGAVLNLQVPAGYIDPHNWSAQSLPTVQNVTSYGADPSGQTDSTAAIQNAIAGAQAAAGGIVYFPTGTYKVSGTLTSSGTAPVTLTGDGWGATVISFTGTGDCIRMTRTQGTAASGGVAAMTIDGANAGAGSSALHIGDGFQYRVDIRVQNFSGAGSIGVHFDNTVWWTEQARVVIYARNCAAGVVFDVSGALTSTSSFARLVADIYIDQVNATFDGLVVQNGAVIYDAAVGLRGNFVSSGSVVTSAALRVTGVIPAGHPGAGSSATITNSRLHVGAECTSGAHTPQTIIFGAAGNLIQSCTGVMDFAPGAANFAASNNNGNMSYVGTVIGDTILQGSVFGQWTSFSAGLPAGWSGTARAKKLADTDLVIVEWSFTIANTTVVTNGETIVTLTNPFFLPTDIKQLPGIVNGGGLANVTAFATLTSGGVLQFIGAGFTAAGGPAFWYGQGVFSNTI